MKALSGKMVLPVFFACLLAVVFSLAWRFERLAVGDPDRYYHFALSREMADAGRLFLDKLPQIEGLGWDRFFAEKEFLFHQLTALGYRAAGDTGVISAVWLFALAGVLVFYAHAQSRGGPLPAFFLSLLFFGNPIILFRLMMVRPHVMAIGFFVLMLLAVLRRHSFLFFLSVLLFTLSYHALYIPLLVIAAAFTADALVHSKLDVPDKGLHLAGAFGLLGGILLNPHFPANVISGVQIALIPFLMGGELKSIGFGAELYPISSDFFLASYFLPLAVLCAAIWQLGRSRLNGDFSILFLVQVCLICLALSFQSRRGAEYFLPACAFLALELWVRSDFFKERNIRRFTWVPACAIVVWFAVGFVVDFRKEPSSYPQEALQAAAALPEEGSVRVFNCDWDTTPYLYYKRPNARFLDIMDPSLLYFADRKAHDSREQLKRARVADAYGFLKNAFKADYVFCRDANVITQLERDPRFRRLYPRSIRGAQIDSQVFVYELKKEPGIEYVKRLDAFFLPVGTQDYARLGPADSEEKSVPVDLSFTGYLDLAAQFKEKIRGLANNAPICAKVVPEMKELVGATHLALGGGRNVRLWKNGKPWFYSDSAYLRAGMHQQLLVFDKALVKSDKLEFVICSAKDSDYWGFSLAGLREQDLFSLCGWKRSLDLTAPDPFAFAQGRRRESCIGSVALPMLPMGQR